MRTRIIQRTVRTETFNEVTGDMVIKERTFWIVQEKKWYWPFWETCGRSFKEKYLDYMFDSYEEANKWRKNRAKGNKKEVRDVIFD